MDTITTSTPVILEANPIKLSPEQLRENYLVYHRKAYDKRRDKVLAHRKARYIPTGRPIGRPRKSRETWGARPPTAPSSDGCD